MISATDFPGVDPGGNANSTNGLRSFFDYCIDNLVDGLIPAGTYLVTPGGLAFDRGFVVRAWPNIATAGAYATVFKVDPATPNAPQYNKPLLKISNGTFPGSGSVDRTWQGGRVGGLRFVDDTNHDAPDRHGIELRGISGAVFEHLRGDNLRGSTVHMDFKVIDGTNPDPYHVSGCEFGVVEGWYNAGRVIANDNHQGWNACSIGRVRAVLTAGGGIKGFGAGNQIDFMVLGSCGGWALDSGPAEWGVLSNFTVGIVELDDAEFGLRVQAYENLRIAGRIMHRHDVSLRKPVATYWPRRAVSLGEGTGGVASNVNLDLIHRVDGGGELDGLGSFTDFNGVGASLVEIDLSVIANVGFAIPDARLVSNFAPSGSASIRVARSGKTILRSKQRRAAYVNATDSSQIGNTYGGAASVVSMPTIRYDESVDYDTRNSGFTVAWSGKIKFASQFFFATSAPGGFVRFYALIERGGTYSTALFARQYTTSTNAERFALAGEFEVLAGDVVHLGADTNDTPHPLTVVISHQTDNFVQYEMVE